MISLKMKKAEPRFRDIKRRRALLRIGRLSWSLERKEALKLYSQLDRYLMDTEGIPIAIPSRKK